MKRQLLKLAIRARFRMTGREKASAQIRESADRYLDLAKAFGPDHGAYHTEVPEMLGVDDDMRGWSFFEILAHNVIVNRSVTEVVRSLALDVEPGSAARINPKTDVMPPPDAGEEQVELFRDSVEDHMRTVDGLPELKGTGKKTHPVFGKLDAHGWHCMFGVHLEVHLKQAEAVLELIGNEEA